MRISVGVIVFDRCSARLSSERRDRHPLRPGHANPQATTVSIGLHEWRAIFGCRARQILAEWLSAPSARRVDPVVFTRIHSPVPVPVLTRLNSVAMLFAREITVRQRTPTNGSDSA